ncbi:MAG: hypothetical protein LBF12_05315 [Christensenellaceae bacterium]|nr:hypothetical protein [Christensenellaceae bacterium]
MSGGCNKPYIRLLEVGRKNGFYAKLELDCRSKKTGFVDRKCVTVSANANLSEVSGREIYEGYEIVGIDCTRGLENIEFSNTDTLALGKTIGGVDELVMKREQIKSTIQLHLEKELNYISRGIKVLSLFFIDEVARYRAHNANDGDTKGIYAKMFEEEYAKLIVLPRFASILERFPENAASVHNGYFSKDKKGAYKDTNGETADDFDTYALIMQKRRNCYRLTPLCVLYFRTAH